MKIILLSGGSGKRLWPLSNDARSKQFLRLLDAPDGEKESMIQRVARQIKNADLTDDITIATGSSQKDAIELQLGDSINVVTEPCRRDTFPAIMLASSYVASRGCDLNEPIVVMPCDSFTEDGYFSAIGRMAKAVEDGVADMVLMGIEPTYPSSKYGYIVPVSEKSTDGVMPVSRFTEKPDPATAERLIAEGALWNGGVFAFRLGYMMDIAAEFANDGDSKTATENYFKILLRKYPVLPKISFDYAVVEKAKSVAVVPYSGQWKDLGTWNTLTDELTHGAYGNVKTEGCESSYIINELEIPIVCIGGKDLVVAASPDGILVTERKLSENLKQLVDGIGKRPMFEERRWGEYKVIDSVEFDDGVCSLTKRLTMLPGKILGYQRHNHHDEVWTFIEGEGEVVVEGERRRVKKGDTVRIAQGQFHGLKADSRLSFIEVQYGHDLTEDDCEMSPYEW